MTELVIPDDSLRAARRAARDIALAALLGGNLFGRVAMHPALAEVSEETERGKVLNRAWRRYGTVNSLALATLLADWLPARRGEAAPLARAKDVALGAVVITGLASAAGGVGFSQQAPEGAVPMASGHDPAPDTPRRATRLKRVINALGSANLAAEVALVAVDASLAGAGLPRRPARRWFRR